MTMSGVLDLVAIDLAVALKKMCSLALDQVAREASGY